MINQAKLDYHKGQFENCNSKQLFQKVNKLSKPKSAKTLPSEVQDVPLADRFSTFFAEKISRIKDCLKDSQSSESFSQPSHGTITSTSTFSDLAMMSEDSVKEIIMKSPSTSCNLDPIPTWLLKKCADELVPIITKIINLSLQNGYFPDSLKSALITPLIKKPSLDSENLKNYRPVANLKFLAKTIERALASQIQDYLTFNNLRGKMQSAYRSGHSIETALLRVYNDLLLAVDKGKEAVLILLDYSAAFDTINHDVFLNRLAERYGITGRVLNWFTSYFQNRSQYISVNNSLSEPHMPLEGVPQGSVIGPLSFTMYTAPLEDIINAHGLGRMIYADDTQVFIILDEAERSSLIPNLENCISDIKLWSTANDLKLNDDKTEVLHITSRFRNPSPLPGVQICDSLIEPVKSARNLGIIVQNDLKMDVYVNNICRSASYGLYRIGQIRKFLDRKSTEMLVHAFITCRLDQCNSLLHNLPESQIAKLQRIQNSAARLVTLTRKHDHVTPILRELHWLPVKYRIMYKILLLTYKCLHGTAPIYLQELIKRYVPSRNLRSATQSRLTCSSTSTQYGQRSFSVSATELWNNLPLHVKNSETVIQFKTSLKTHLFTMAF